MGRRKGSKNKKKKATATKEPKKTFLSEFMGGLVFVLGLALIVLFKFDNIGAVADNINMFFTGLLGEARILFPIACMYIGVTSILANKKKNVGAELLKGGLGCNYYISLYRGLELKLHHICHQTNHVLKHTYKIIYAQRKYSS